MKIHGKGYRGDHLTDCGLSIYTEGLEWAHPGGVTCQECLKAERDIGIKYVAEAISEWELSEEELEQAVELSKVMKVMGS